MRLKMWAVGGRVGRISRSCVVFMDGGSKRSSSHRATFYPSLLTVVICPFFVFGHELEVLSHLFFVSPPPDPPAPQFLARPNHGPRMESIHVGCAT